jgi:hypothetical protein
VQSEIGMFVLLVCYLSILYFAKKLHRGEYFYTVIRIYSQQMLITGYDKLGMSG